MTQFELYPYPNPKDKTPLFINDPLFADISFQTMEDVKNSANEPDNIRVYAVLDLSKTSITRRLGEIVNRYGAASEDNESNYSLEVERLTRVFQRSNIKLQISDLGTSNISFMKPVKFH